MTAVPEGIPAARPARFEAWTEDTKTRAYELWATLAGGSAPRTEHLLAHEAGAGVAVPGGSAPRTEHLLAHEAGAGVAVPAASTIRAWAAAEGWAEQRDRDRAQTHGQTLRELQGGFLSAVVLAEHTMRDAMLGLLDDEKYGGAGRIKAAEAVLRLAERSGVRFLASAMELHPPDLDDDAGLTDDQRIRKYRSLLMEENRLQRS